MFYDAHGDPAWGSDDDSSDDERDGEGEYNGCSDGAVYPQQRTLLHHWSQAALERVGDDGKPPRRSASHPQY